MDYKIYLGGAAVLVILAGAVLTGSFSGLDLNDTGCEWTTVETDDGQTFSSLEDLESYLGEDEFSQQMDRFEQSDSMDIREPWFGDVEYRRCVQKSWEN